MNVHPPPANKTHFQHKRLLTAAVIGLLLRMLFLANEGTLILLSPARRIILVIIALRLLMMVHSSFEAVEQTKSLPRYTGWRAGILPILLMTPMVVGFWLAAWSTGGGLLGVTGYALAASLIMILLILNFIGLLMKSAKEPSAENDVVRPQIGVGEFLVDALFSTVYGLMLFLGIVGLMVLAPEALDDSIAIGNFAFYVYGLMLVGQAVIWFFSGLIRQAAEESGLRQQSQ
ncbi:MAG: hypothetical protein K8L97_01955 [Anaerolineae bacterium]|nr:hypothetical protein [Anaerolineae bacterium]